MVPASRYDGVICWRMRMRHRPFFKAIVVASAVLVFSLPCYGRVLVVHSCHEQFEWVQGVNKALSSSFRSEVAYRIFLHGYQATPR
jgi:hypothetical protein